MPAEKYVLALDAGTSGAHAAVCALDGALRAVATAPWRYTSPRGVDLGAKAFPPHRFWRALGQAAQRVLKAADISPKDVAAVAVTGQRLGLVALDADGRELYAGPDLDARAFLQDAALDEGLRGRIYSTTGHLPGFLLAPLKLLWLREHAPRRLARVKYVVPVDAWALARTTGSIVAERAAAGECGLLDITSREPCRELFNTLGLPEGVLPPLVAAGSVVGSVTSAAAEALGVPEGIPAVAAGPDTQCGLLGMGVVEPGQVGVVVGWSGAVQRVVAAPVFDAQRRTWAGLHLAPKRWVAESNLGAVGYAYRWLIECLSGRASDAAYRRLETTAAGVLPGADSVFVFLGPRPLDPARLGVRPGGFSVPVPLVAGEWGRGHLVRATLESIAYAIKAGVRQVEEVTGTPVQEVSLGGGMARSMIFPQVLADVLARPVLAAPVAPVSPVGAALCAATAMGVYGSLAEAGGSQREKATALHPDPVAAAEYEDLYRRWCAFVGRMESLVEVLS